MSAWLLRADYILCGQNVTKCNNVGYLFPYRETAAGASPHFDVHANDYNISHKLSSRERDTDRDRETMSSSVFPCPSFLCLSACVTACGMKSDAISYITSPACTSRAPWQQATISWDCKSRRHRITDHPFSRGRPQLTLVVLFQFCSSSRRLCQMIRNVGYETTMRYCDNNLDDWWYIHSRYARPPSLSLSLSLSVCLSSRCCICTKL